MVSHAAAIPGTSRQRRTDRNGGDNGLPNDDPAEIRPAAASEPNAGGEPPSSDEPDPRRWKALAICLVGGFMVLLDVSIVNVALPSIRSGLNASSDQLQWVLSGYALAFGLLLVPAGRLGDVRGRRTVFVLALGLFTLASVACGAAPSSTWLVAGRLLQGLAGGMLTPQISALIQQLFSGKERGKAFGLFGTVVGVSTAIGPLLGGLLIQAFGEANGWRFVFFVNLPIGLVAMPLAWRLLPHPRKGKGHDFDPVGVVLLGVGVVTLLLPLVQEQQWRGPAKWWLVPLAVLILVAFALWERRYQRRGHEPMVDLSLFSTRSYSFGIGMISFYFAGFTPLFFVLTLYLQNGLGYSALLAGLVSLPFALGSGGAAAIGGRLVDRYGRPLVLIGLLAVSIGLIGCLVAVHLAPQRGTGWATLLPLLIAGLGSGLVISPNQTITLSQVPVERAGTAGGLLQTGQRIGSAIGIAAAGSVFFAALGGADAAQQKPGPGSATGFARAFEHGLWVAIGLIVLALVVALVDVLVDRRRRETPAPERPGRPRVADADTYGRHALLPAGR